MAIPLVLLGAYELALLAAGAIGSMWLASPQGREATRSAGQALSEALSNAKAKAVPAAPSTTAECEQPRCDDKCGPLLQEIERVMQELRDRQMEMLIDKFGLYPIRPRKLPGIGSWPGHVEQYQGWQARLRGLLEKAIKAGCPIPPDGWRAAMQDPPARPMRK